MSEITKATGGNLAPVDLEQLHRLSQEANQQAAANVFWLYRSTKSSQTTRRQLADLRLFAAFLQQVADVEVVAEDFYTTPRVWGSISAGLVEAWRVWMLGEGYASGSINVRMATIKTYSKLAYGAGSVDRDEHLRIQAIRGYSQGEARRVDERRAATRMGHKKESATRLTREDVQSLKTLQGQAPAHYRDRLLMTLLLDHGLRCEELALLTVGGIDLAAGLITFRRPKVDLLQRHRLSQDALAAAYEYMQLLPGAPVDSPLLRASNKSNLLLDVGMGTRGINKCVGRIGKQLGVDGLSPHDCRHAWATAAAKGTPLNVLMAAGGWSSPAMPMRYIEKQTIANEGIRIDY